MLRFVFLSFAIVLSISVSATAQMSSIAATDGTQFLALDTGGFTFSGDSGIDRSGNGNNEEDIAVFLYDFNASAGQTVSFDYNFLTAETPTTDFFSDNFEINLNGTQVVAGAVGTNNGAFPQLFGFDLNPINGNNSFFGSGQIGFQSAASSATVTGINTLEFFVGDDGDPVVDSALLVDNITLDNVLIESFEVQPIGIEPLPGLPGSGDVTGGVTTEGPGSFTFVPLPEPSSLMVMFGMGIAVLGRRRR